MRYNIHTHHENYLALLTEFLLRRTLEQEQWEVRRARQLETLALKERIWAREPGALATWLMPYLGRIELQLEITEPALKSMKGYSNDAQRAEYTHLTDYRAMLLDEKDRVKAALASNHKHAANNNVDVDEAATTSSTSEQLAS